LQISKLIKIALPTYERFRQDQLQPYRKGADRIVILITVGGDGSYCGRAHGGGRITSNERECPE
jgi:hypothetical protein